MARIFPSLGNWLALFVLQVALHLRRCQPLETSVKSSLVADIPRHTVSQCIKEPTTFCSCAKITDAPRATPVNDNNTRSKQLLKIGILLPFTIDTKHNVGAYRSGKYYASAMCISVDDINKSQLLPDHNVQLVWANTKCDWKSTVRAQYKMIHDENVDAFIGGCNEDCKISAHVSAAFNMPMISHQCNDPDLTNTTNFPTFGRTETSNGRQLTPAIQQLLEHFKWKKFSLIVEGATTYKTIAEHIKDSFGDNCVYHKEVDFFSYKYNFEKDFKRVKEELKNVSKESRIILLLMDIRIAKEWLIAAWELSMINGDYVFITFEVHINDGKKYFEKNYKWIFDDLGPEISIGRSKKLCEAWNSALLVMTKVPGKDNNNKLQNFYTQVRNGMKTWFNMSTYIGKKSTPPYYAINLYDAVMSYAVAVNKTIRKQGKYNDGTYILKIMADTEFQSIGGYKIYFDTSGDVQLPFIVYHYGRKGERCNYSMTEETTIEHAAAMEPFLEIDIRWKKVTRIPGSHMRWPNSDNNIHNVRDEPKCGFDGKKCGRNKTVKDYIGIPVALTVVIILFVITPIIIYRQYRLEKELASQLWKISLNELQFYDWRSSTVSLQSTYATYNPGQSSRRQMVAYYHGNVVNVRRIFKKNVDLNHAVLMELKQVRDLRHNNSNPFIGACVDYKNILIVTQYGVRGSLHDVLLKGDIKLDTLFYLSLLNDIVKGMRYLHQTDIKSHGNLKSSNCVIDSRWTLKITDFGLTTFKSKQDNSHMDSTEFHRSLLWHAPELLRLREPIGRGTQKGDVYSFAIIIQEFHTREGPWSTAYLKPWEIVQRLRKVENPPFRPHVPQLIENAESLRVLMKRCWSETEDDRPHFKDIQGEIRNLMKANGLKMNMLDNMVELMEKYTNHLEEIVTQRTGELISEKHKTEALIMQVLPQSVARQLIKGQQVEAESFSEVSIYFSDIVGFTALCSDSSPMQIISLLNDLYTLFDSVISHYEVYKVETIGDAYMVVSGLPIRNERKHATEISLMALHILNSVKTFKVQHRPDEQLLLRIGLHTGPVVAGVVGKTMPRYCLFGDTVNYSSRMESTGEPLRIHISQSMYDIIHASGGFVCQEGGETHLKGIGYVITYWLLSSQYPERESIASNSVSVLSVLGKTQQRSKTTVRQLSSPGGCPGTGSPIFDFPRSFERTNSLRSSLRDVNGYVKKERTLLENKIGRHHQLQHTNSCV